jgi:hypothetical protein
MQPLECRIHFLNQAIEMEVTSEGHLTRKASQIESRVCKRWIHDRHL